MNIEDFHIVRQDNKRAWAYCPKHNDKHTPNLCISLMGEYCGFFYCFACGYRGYVNIPDNIQRQVVKMIKRQPINIDWNKLSFEYQKKYGKYDDEIIIEEIFDVSTNSIFDFMGGWDGEAFTFPMYDANFDTIGIHRRLPDGKKCCVEGSKLGLFIPCGYKQKLDEILYICEGISDTISVYDLGFMVIGLPCATYGIDIIIKWIENNYLSTPKVVTILDNDKAGISATKHLSNALYGNLDIESKSFNFVGAKDIRDYIKLVGKQQVKYELSKV